MAISLSSAISGKREPKRANRWVLKFETIPYPAVAGNVQGAQLSNGATDASESLAIDLVSASRPTLNLNMGEISRLNEKWKFAQNPTWEPITVTFYDFDSGLGSASQIMWRWVQTVYDVLNGTMGYAATYKVDASLILLGPGQTQASPGTRESSTLVEIIEAWDLFGCFPNNYSAGELNYESTDALRITTEIVYDYANLHTLSDTGGEGGTWKLLT
jgi:hypothetical protein